MAELNEIDALKELLLREPKDREARFRLGALLLAQRDYQGAIINLQQCKADLRFKVQAIQMMIEAFKAKKFYDLASQLATELNDGEDPDGNESPKRPVPQPPLLTYNKNEERA